MTADALRANARRLLAALSAVLGACPALRAQDCATPHGPDVLAGIPRAEWRAARAGGGTVNVAVFFRRVVEDDGSGGPDPAELLEEMERLEGTFAPHGICFTHAGYDDIPDSDYASGAWTFAATSRIDSALVADHPPIAGAVNVYVLPDYTFFRGTAYAIPNTYLTVTAGRFDTPHLAHEMGHCLGLYHTHHTDFGDELVNGSNCATAGDLLCDTPADPELEAAFVNAACAYIGPATDANGESYMPLTDNVMSYAPFACRAFFTLQQAARMHATLGLSGGPLAGVQPPGTRFLYWPISAGTQVQVATDRLTYGTFSGLAYRQSGTARIHAAAGQSLVFTPGIAIEPASGGRFAGRVSRACDGIHPLIVPGSRPAPQATEPGVAGPGWTVAPIPSSGTVHLRGPDPVSRPYRVVDLTGSTRKAGTAGHGSVLDLGALPNGPYLLLLSDPSGPVSLPILIHR